MPVEVLVGIVGLLGAFTAELVGSGSGLVLESVGVAGAIPPAGGVRR